MAENPQGYWPDVPFGWVPSGTEAFTTEVVRATNRRQQRRRVPLPTTTNGNGQRSWTAKVATGYGLTTADRQAVSDLWRAKYGASGAFYFFTPSAQPIVDKSLGTLSSATRIIIPYKGSTISDVRVAGVSQTFSVTPLTLRSGFYASVRNYGSSGSYINVGSNAVLRPAGDMTVAAWIWVGGGSGTNRAILSSEVFPANGFLFSLDAGSNKLLLRTNHGTADVAFSSFLPSVGQWQHVAAVKSGTNVTFYLNGAAANTVGSINNAVASTTALAVGGYIGLSSFSFDGMLNDVRLYDVAVSAAELSKIYAGSASPSANLRGWWKLTDGLSSFAGTAADTSGYGNHGTFSGSLAWVSGEDEVVFGAPQTGATTATLYGRERVTAHFANDALPHTFLEGGGTYPVFDLSIEELLG